MANSSFLSDQMIAQEMLKESMKEPVIEGRSDRLANVGIPVSFGMNRGLSDGNMSVMPDGTGYAEVPTSDIDSRNPKKMVQRLDETMDDIQLTGSAKKFYETKTRPYLGRTRVDDSRFIERGSGEFFDKSNLIKLDRTNGKEKQQIVGDHEWGHAGQAWPFRKLYRMPRDYDARMGEKTSNMFSGRQYDKEYTNPSSESYIPPLSLFNPDKGVFESVSDTYMQASRASKGRQPSEESLKKYNIDLDNRTAELNDRLSKDSAFKKYVEDKNAEEALVSQRTKLRNMTMTGALWDGIFGE